MNNIFLVGFGGFWGSIFRYLLFVLIPSSPLSICIINLTGCFLLGIINGLLSLYSPLNNDVIRLFFCTGFLGAYTTFSSFELINLGYIRNGESWQALGYTSIQIIAGIFLLQLGEFCFRKVQFIFS